MLHAKAVFLALNEEREAQGQEIFKNPRNAAAGGLRQLDPRAVADRQLNIFLYSAVYTDQFHPESQAGLFAAFEQLGLRTNPLRRECQTAEEVIDYIQMIGQQRHDLPYEIDGVVIKVNRIDQQQVLGFRLLNRPGSKLIEQMDYYIKPVESEECEVGSKSDSTPSPLATTHLRIASPEDIRICDPACGSGHMLAYAFDLLYAIYEEEGYDPAEIPEKILTNNLYGIEIDERAGELAAFALTMKARAKQRRFFNKGVKPNICVLENVHFDEGELKNYMDFVGRDLFTAPLQTTLRQFEEADNFGSLIRPDVTDVDGMLRILESKDVSGQLFLSPTHQKVLQALRQADYLSPKYHVVIANPPYMGSKGMNGRLGAWAKDNYPDSKSDLFAMFIERALDMALAGGAVCMITMQSWMFLSSFEALRGRILNQHTILSMAHLGARGFDSIGGEVVSTTAFVLENAHKPDYRGAYLRLVDGNSEAEKKELLFKAIAQGLCA